MQNRIKLLRKELNLNQKEFGELIGIKQNTVSQYENGIRPLSSVAIIAICKEFNVDKKWLLTGEGDSMFIDDGDPNISAIVSNYHLSEKDKLIFTNYLNMSIAKRKLLNDLIAELLNTNNSNNNDEEIQ